MVLILRSKEDLDFSLENLGQHKTSSEMRDLRNFINQAPRAKRET